MLTHSLGFRLRGSYGRAACYVMKELDFAFLLLLWVCRGENLFGKISLACPNELEAGT